MRPPRRRAARRSPSATVVLTAQREHERGELAEPRRRGSPRDARPARAANGSPAPKWSDTALSRAVARSAAVGGPDRRGQRGAGRCRRRRPSRRRSRPKERNRASRPSGARPRQLIPVPQTTAIAPAAVGAGAQQRLGVVADDELVAPAQPLERRRAARPAPPGRRSRQAAAARWRRAAARRDRVPPAPRAVVEQALEHLDAAVDSEIVELAAAAAHVGAAALRSASSSARSVLTPPPSTARTSPSRRRSRHRLVGRSRAPVAPAAPSPASRSSSSVVGQSVLADQRVGEQRHARAGRGRARRRPTPRSARRRRRAGPGRAARARAGAAPRGTAPSRPIRAGTSTTSSSARPASVRAVADVDDLDVAGVADQRADQLDRGLAVERAAALLEQRRLLGERRVAVEVEQPALDLHHRLRARRLDPPAPRRPRARRRSSAGSRTGSRPVARAARAAARSPRPARRRSRSMTSGSTSRPSTHTARIQVRWLRPTWSTWTRSTGRPRCAAIWRWKLIATLQSPIARCPASSSARVTIPTGLVKSTIHASGRRELTRPLGDLEHDRHRPHRLAQPAGAGRLLADAAARGRDRLVAQPRRLPADPDLDQDHVGALERPVERAGDLERAVEALALEHPPGQAAHHLAPLRVDVVEHQAR